jgi:hypothetical protein
VDHCRGSVEVVDRGERGGEVIVGLGGGCVIG